MKFSTQVQYNPVGINVNNESDHLTDVIEL